MEKETNDKYLHLDIRDDIYAQERRDRKPIMSLMAELTESVDRLDVELKELKQLNQEMLTNPFWLIR